MPVEGVLVQQGSMVDPVLAKPVPSVKVASKLSVDGAVMMPQLVCAVMGPIQTDELVAEQTSLT